MSGDADAAAGRSGAETPAASARDALLGRGEDELMAATCVKLNIARPVTALSALFVQDEDGLRATAVQWRMIQQRVRWFESSFSAQQGAG